MVAMAKGPMLCKNQNIHFFFQFLLFLGSKSSKKCIFCLSETSENARYYPCRYTICSKNAIRLAIKWAGTLLLWDKKKNVENWSSIAGLLSNLGYCRMHTVMYFFQNAWICANNGMVFRVALFMYFRKCMCFGRCRFRLFEITQHLCQIST